MKHPYLVSYDYGQGSVWVILMAESAEQIQAKYPQLHVLESPPHWMSENYLSSIRDRRTLDIEDEEDDFLASLRAEQG